MRVRVDEETEKTERRRKQRKNEDRTGDWGRRPVDHTTRHGGVFAVHDNRTGPGNEWSEMKGETTESVILN